MQGLRAFSHCISWIIQVFTWLLFESLVIYRNLLFQELIVDLVSTNCSLNIYILCLTVHLQDLGTQQEVMPLVISPSITSSSKSLQKNSCLPAVVSSLKCSGSQLDAPLTSSGLVICSTLQFSFEELRRRRQQRLFRTHSSSFMSGSVKMRRSIWGQLNLKIKTTICFSTYFNFIGFWCRCYAAATLELSQPENEERKAGALAAATTELERLFRKDDFGRMKVISCIIILFIFLHAWLCEFSLARFTWLRGLFLLLNFRFLLMWRAWFLVKNILLTNYSLWIYKGFMEHPRYNFTPVDLQIWLNRREIFF